ncbi:cyclase family protein [Catenulispora sp. GAS73]|uniref:cyclase family protein n=1 Tax=Catenulispora sp. GAS73 TaxID=3156269 RepID=UPI0035149206
MPVIDLSHLVRPGMSTYPGLPGPEIGDYMTFEESRSHYAEGTEFQISRFSMLTCTGTYLDAPLHRFPDGADVGQVALERCAMLPAVVVDARGLTEIDDECVPADVSDCAVLFFTGWDRHWGTDAYGSQAHPHLTEAAGDRLVRSGAVLVGIDSVNIDGTSTGERPIHTGLLRAGVLIVENLTNLGAVPSRGSRFTGAPVAFLGLPSFPVRAFATF